MSKGYKNISKLILSCSIGTALLFNAAYALEYVEDDKIDINKSLDTASSSIKLEGGVAITQKDQLVTLSLRDSDIKQVLRMLADKAGLNIIFHSSVSGDVTLDLVNVTLNKAFEYVLSVNNLNYWLDNETLFVAASSSFGELGVKKQQITPVQVKYMDAVKVANFLNTNIFGLNKPGLSSDQVVITNPIKNEVLIFGTDKDVKLAKDVIAQIDTKPLVREFDVNHMTSGQMAQLLCQSVFGDESPSSSSSPDGTGGGNIVCTAEGTGVAAGGSGENSVSLASLEGTAYQVIEFPDLGKITITGATQQQLEMAEEFIAKTDKKQPQIYLEMSIVELNENGSKALSSTWAYYNGKFGIDGGYAAASVGEAWDGKTGSPLERAISVIEQDTLEPTKWIPAVDANGIQLETAGGDAMLMEVPNLVEHEHRIPGGYTFTGQGSGTGGNNQNGVQYHEVASPRYSNQLAQHISFLVTSSKGRTLASPKVIATNNRATSINLTADYLESVETTVTTTTTTPVTNRNYNIAQAGIEITITPRIAPNGYVSLDIAPNYSTIQGQLSDSNGDTLATFLNKRELNLENVRVKDGETLVIAGLTQEQETVSQQKIPFLGDLPILGSLFRSTSKNKAKSELIIMVTPKVINDDGDGEFDAV